MSDAFISKFVNSEIMKRGGDAVPLNEQGYGMITPSFHISGLRESAILKSGILIKGKGFLNDIASLSYVGIQTREFTLTIVADGNRILRWESPLTGASLNAILLLRRPASYIIQGVTPASSTTPFDGLPIAFNESLEIDFEIPSIAPLATHGAVFTANIWSHTSNVITEYEYSETSRILLFTTSSVSDVPLQTSFVVTDEILNNTARIWAIGAGGSSTTATGGANGQQITDYKIPLRYGDVVDLSIGAPTMGGGTAVSARQTRISITDQPEIVLAGGTAGGAGVGVHTPPHVIPFGIFENSGRGASSLGGTNVRGFPGRVVIAYEVDRGE